MNNLLSCLVLFAIVVTTVAVSARREPPLLAQAEVHVCDEIVPLVEISPGETKELHLACSRSMKSRGDGLGLRKIKRTSEGVKFLPIRAKENGISISVPDMDSAAKAGDWAPEYSDLVSQSLYPFVVTIAADANAEPQVLKIRVENSTCSGVLATDFCVLVSEKAVSKRPK